MIAWLALLLGAASVAYVWKLNLEFNTATRRLDRYNRALYDANDDLRKLREELAATTAQLRVEMKQRNGTLAFAPSMTVREAQLLHPQAEQIMAGFHLGGCDHCAVEPDETLAQISAEHGVELETLLGNLNLLVSGPQRGEPQLVKIPNVALEF